MDTSDIITVSIVGVYTLVYVIIFFIQKSQIDKQKSVIESMEKFINVFKVEEVEKYVTLTNKNVMMEAADKVRQSKDELRDEIIIPEVNKIKGELKDQYDEMASVLYNVIIAFPEKERKDFINQHLKKNSKMFLEALEKNKNA